MICSNYLLQTSNRLTFIIIFLEVIINFLSLHLLNQKELIP